MALRNEVYKLVDARTKGTYRYEMGARKITSELILETFQSWLREVGLPTLRDESGRDITAEIRKLLLLLTDEPDKPDKEGT